MDVDTLTIAAYGSGLAQKKFSITEVTEGFLKRVQDDATHIHAFLSVDVQGALARARDLDSALPSLKDMPLLYGVPMAIKDNILIEGIQATAASRMLASYTASYDATVIKKLKAAGSVFIGKTNLDEFAMGSSTENSAFGPTKNPHDTTKVPGGSSGGSAAAVAAHMALGALGSDTGGSIRQPAAFCGVVGLKPTYGAVSRYGAIALASSLDQIGPFAQTVEDVAIIFEAIAGKDVHDATSADTHFKRMLGAERVRDKKITIGIPKEYFVDGISPEVTAGMKRVIDRLTKGGFSFKEVSLPHTKYALSCYYIIMPAEASSNLARFDGIRYAGHVRPVESLQERYVRNRQEGFGDEPTRRILLGTFVLSSGYYDAYYAKAQKIRRLIQNDFTDVFDSGVDVLLTPTTPTTAFAIGEKKDNPLEMYLSDIFTIPVNLAGLPALSLPVDGGLYTPQRMPIGFQLIGKHFHEADIIQLGRYYEEHLR